MQNDIPVPGRKDTNLCEKLIYHFELIFATNSILYDQAHFILQAQYLFQAQ